MRTLFFHGRPSPQRTLVGIQKNPFVAAAATGMLLLWVGLGGGTMEAAPLVLNPDGAWCWFQDERVVIDNRQTSDHGQTWQWQAITSNSPNDNLRPLVPARHPGKTFVLWFRGVYRAYTDYRTEVVAFTDVRNLPPMKEPQWRGTNP